MRRRFIVRGSSGAGRWLCFRAWPIDRIGSGRGWIAGGGDGGRADRPGLAAGGWIAGGVATVAAIDRAGIGSGRRERRRDCDGAAGPALENRGCSDRGGGTTAGSASRAAASASDATRPGALSGCGGAIGRGAASGFHRGACSDGSGSSASGALIVGICSGGGWRASGWLVTRLQRRRRAHRRHLQRRLGGRQRMRAAAAWRPARQRAGPRSTDRRP